MRFILAVFVTAILSLSSSYALAQAQPSVKMGGGKLVIGEEQKLMLDASKKVMKKNFKGAEAVYGKVIEMNGSNSDAYLQRSVVRREMGDIAGSQSDAKAVIRLSEIRMQKDPGNASSYHQRGSAYRLLKEYELAKKDLATAVRISGKPSWQNDLRAVELEEKLDH